MASESYSVVASLRVNSVLEERGLGMLGLKFKVVVLKRNFQVFFLFKLERVSYLLKHIFRLLKINLLRMGLQAFFLIIDIRRRVLRRYAIGRDYRYR